MLFEKSSSQSSSQSSSPKPSINCQKDYSAKSDSTQSRQPLLCWLSTILLVIGCCWMIPHGDFRQVGTVPQFWVGSTIMSLGFLLSWPLTSISARWFWGVAIATRLLFLLMYPGDDIWRYLWEGHLQTLGISPYHFAPEAPELLQYRTDWWTLINHRDISAIYPPVTQWGFRFLAMITPSVGLFKLAFTLADLGMCWGLSRRFGYQRTLLYAWNPLVLYSFAGGGHYDSWFMLPLVAAWLVFDHSGTAPPSNSPLSLAGLPIGKRRRIGISPLTKGGLRGGMQGVDGPNETSASSSPMRWGLSAFLIGISIAVKWITLPVLGFLMWQALWQSSSEPLPSEPSSGEQSLVPQVGWAKDDRTCPSKCPSKRLADGHTFVFPILRNLPINKVPQVGWAKDDRACPSKTLADGHTFVLPILRRMGNVLSPGVLMLWGLILLCGALPLLITAIPFCTAESCPLIPVSSGFVAHGRSAELVPHLVHLIWPASLKENWLYAFPLGLSVLWLLGRSPTFLVFTETYFIFLLLLSPVIHAWYFAWLVPFAVASRNLGTRLTSLSVFIYFVLQHRIALDGLWELTPIERMVLWGPLVMGWLWTLWHNTRDANGDRR